MEQTASYLILNCPELTLSSHKTDYSVSWSHIITHCKEGKSTCINGKTFYTTDSSWQFNLHEEKATQE